MIFSKPATMRRTSAARALGSGARVVVHRGRKRRVDADLDLFPGPRPLCPKAASLFVQALSSFVCPQGASDSPWV